MKEKIKIVVVTVVLLFIFIGIFFIGKKISLNSYLNNTNKYSSKINYSSSYILNIESVTSKSKMEYSIARTSGIKNIIINKYDDEELTSSINKYLVTNNNKTECYSKDGDEYKASCSNKEDFKLDYNKLKNSIIKIKKADSEVINGISYKKYTVLMKKSDAYNLIYEKDIMSEKDLPGNIDVKIYVDKSKSFVYKINYVIDNLSNDKANNIKYYVEITNYDINNNNVIKLPF